MNHFDNMSKISLCLDNREKSKLSERRVKQIDTNAESVQNLKLLEVHELKSLGIFIFADVMIHELPSRKTFTSNLFHDEYLWFYLPIRFAGKQLHCQYR